MPDFANNSRPMSSVNVKFTLASFVAILLLIGTTNLTLGEVNSPTGRVSRFDKDDSTEERWTPLIPTDNKFLASLRFWEKPKNSPQSKSATTSHGTTPPPHAAPRADNGSPASGTLIQHRSAITDAATEPSSNSYNEQRHGTLGDAPLPWGGGSLTPDSGSGEVPMPQETKPGMQSHLSYSFDTRDWVEFFPSRQEQDKTHDEETLKATQKTSLRETTLRISESPTLQESSEESQSEEEDWNGHATTLVTHIQHDLTHTPLAPPTIPDTTSPRTDPPQTPHIDLSPSYQKRLPHVQTYGVIVVQANFPLTEIASILEEINQLQHDLTRYIGVPEPEEKIELCLFKDDESYSRFLREFFPKAPLDRRALYVKLNNKPGTLMVQQSKHFEIDLRHEMTHAIIHASIPTVPIWLHEGLAKYFEVPPHDRADKNPYMSKIHWNARLGNIPSLDRLIKLETIDDMGAKEYQDSWAWTHFLIHRSPETHRLLAAYLQMLATWTGKDEEFTSNGSAISLPGGRTFGLTLTSTREKAVPTPSLKPYLDEIMSNQREAFKEHFGVGTK
jgi:hypothetical protein